MSQYHTYAIARSPASPNFNGKILLFFAFDPESAYGIPSVLRLFSFEGDPELSFLCAMRERESSARFT